MVLRALQFLVRTPIDGQNSRQTADGIKANLTPAAVHNLTDICWTKCVTGSIKSGTLDKSEETCARNCVDRFLDANFLVIKQLEGMRR